MGQSLAESGYNLISRHPKVVLGDAATWRQSEWTLDMEITGIMTSAANRLIGEVVQSQSRPLLGPSPG